MNVFRPRIGVKRDDPTKSTKTSNDEPIKVETNENMEIVEESNSNEIIENNEEM